MAHCPTVARVLHVNVTVFLEITAVLNSSLGSVLVSIGLVLFWLDMRGRLWTVLLGVRLTLSPLSGGLLCPLHALLCQLLLDCWGSPSLCPSLFSKGRVRVKLRILDCKRLVLINPHLPESKRHPLLYIWPLLILLLQYITGE